MGHISVAKLYGDFAASSREEVEAMMAEALGDVGPIRVLVHCRAANLHGKFVVVKATIEPKAKARLGALVKKLEGTFGSDVKSCLDKPHVTVVKYSKAANGKAVMKLVAELKKRDSSLNPRELSLAHVELSQSGAPYDNANPSGRTHFDNRIRRRLASCVLLPREEDAGVAAEGGVGALCRRLAESQL